MLYDRKTELLWNYIGIAQFSDLSKFWNSGSASYGGDTSDSQTPDDPTTIRGDSDDAGAGPAGRPGPADAMSFSGSAAGSGKSESFPAARAEEQPPHVGAAPAAHPMGEHHASGNSFPLSGGGSLRFTHEYSVSHAHSGRAASGQDSGDAAEAHADDAPSGTLATTAQPPTHDEPPVLPEEPKIYGPSDVHMEGEVIGGGSTQTNTVIHNDGSELHGWSDLGGETIANLINQITTPDSASPFQLSIDYIHGDLTSITSLTQLNTIYDNDINQSITSITAGSHSLISNADIAQSIDSGGNQSFNTATLLGNQALDGYDALVVTGDLTKINKIMQVNLIVDNDVNQTTAEADINMPSGTASSVWDAAIQSGGNIEVNIGFIIDQQSGSVYLVGGFYGSSHGVTQLNILSDADINDILHLFQSQEGTGFLDLSAYGHIVSGGDSQSNTAGFVDGSDGSGSHAPIPLSDLTTLLACAGLSPDNGDVKVLFVDGNYTIINLVVQINVINDTDHNTQIITADGAMGSLDAPAPESDATDASAAGTGGSSDGTAADTDGTGQDNGDGQTPPDADPGGEPASGDVSASVTGSPDTTHDGASTVTGDTPQAGVDHTGDSPAASSGNGGGGLPVYTDHGNLNYDQVTSSGGNEAGNHAVLIDGGSGPLVQIVQGSYTEYNEIYQVNILLDNDHNQITTAMNSDSPAGASDSPVPDTTHAVSADDVLHKMMT